MRQAALELSIVGGELHDTTDPVRSLSDRASHFHPQLNALPNYDGDRRVGGVRSASSTSARRCYLASSTARSVSLSGARAIGFLRNGVLRDWAPSALSADGVQPDIRMSGSDG